MFRNRFVTETDEAVRNDCTVCALIMTLGYGTLDLMWKKTDGSIATNEEIKARRERLRVLSGDTSGGTSIEDCVIGAEKLWPYFDIKCSHIPMSTVETRWKAGYAGVVQGNPSAVSNVSSRLRRWTNNDNYGHAIKAGPMHSDGAHVFVQDPMGYGGYTGEWVPLTEIRQFMRAMRRADGTYHTFLVKEGSLLSTISLITETKPARPFSVSKGIRKIGYKMDAETGRYLLRADKTLAAPLTGTVQLVDVKQYPAAQKPNGACVLVVTASDPAYVGTVMSTAAVTIGALPPLPTGSITEAQLAAAKAEAARVASDAGLLAGFNQAIDAGKSALETLRK